MIKRFLIFFLLIISICCPSQAQNQTELANKIASIKHDPKHSRISLIICTEGNESWESFGHSTIRVIDSTRTDLGKDVIYNYGVFDFFDGSFAYKFLKGQMHAYLEVAPYPFFIRSYVYEGRGISEWEFLLNDAQKASILSYLENNATIENRYYSYDLVYDNCTTRIRDLFTKTFGSNLILSQVVPKDSYLTFRKVCEEYCVNKHWLRLAFHIFFASKTDITATNAESMYVPLYLERGLCNATLDGHKLCGDKIMLSVDKLDKPSGINDAFLFILIFSLITAICLSVKKLAVIGKVMSSFILVLTGLLGCCLLYTWFCSAHLECRNNYNLLWALPTNIVLPFLNARIKAKYSIVAMCLLVVAVIAHLMKIQVMPMFEIGSLLLLLFYIYFKMFKNGRADSRKNK